MELTYHWEGDVLIPDLELEDGSNYQIGKYGRMRQRYLFENHHAMYTHLVLTEKLWKHLEEVDMECNDMVDMLTVRMAERVVGMNTENTEINEGTINFDIVFYVRMKDGLSQIIVNVEAQKDMPTEYHILNRAIFYACRLVSSQKERDFVNKKYDDIKQVYTIWICMNMDYNSLSHIHLAKDEMLSPYDWKGNMDLLNIVLVGITNDIPEHDENYEMHRLIGALLSTELREQEKLDIIEHEYNIPISNELREDVRIMCNLSTGIEEKATEKTSEKFILNMYKKGYTLDQIADIAETSVAAVEAVIKKKEPAMA